MTRIVADVWAKLVCIVMMLVSRGGQLLKKLWDFIWGIKFRVYLSLGGTIKYMRDNRQPDFRGFHELERGKVVTLPFEYEIRQDPGELALKAADECAEANQRATRLLQLIKFYGERCARYVDFQHPEDDDLWDEIGKAVQFYVMTDTPSVINAKIGTLALEVVGGKDASMLWDTKSLLINGHPAPPFRRLTIEGDVDKPWTVKLEFMPKAWDAQFE